jgi:adenine specific DNA methylase Mod
VNTLTARTRIILIRDRDWHVAHYAKVILDEVFGADHFRNEIIWRRSNPKSHITVNFPTSTDAILYYTKSDDYKYTQQYTEHDPDYVDSAYKYSDKYRRYRLLPLLKGGHATAGCCRFELLNG